MTSERDYRDFLYDMLEYAELAADFVSGMDLANFEVDRRTSLAVIKALEIIGEAARYIPASARRRYTNIPWRQIISMRNIVVHEYPSVDLEVIWATVRDDLPPLKSQLRKIIRELQ